MDDNNRSIGQVLHFSMHSFTNFCLHWASNQFAFISWYIFLTSDDGWNTNQCGCNCPWSYNCARSHILEGDFSQDNYGI